ncbi:MAG: ATP-binding cassette domain-containing protein [Gammaproteobacteria bacterium]|nr:MAG: ATP-binding cassette domain-containing protein [Gammaproteobacteria bacterium]
MPSSACASEPSAPVLRARGLVKRYGPRAALDGVDLALARGECLGLLGPNGAGKTTFLRLVLGHTPPSGGSLEVLGLPVPARAREARARLGVVPQHDNLDPDFTVAENLRTYAAYFGLPRREIEARLPGLLRFAALEGRAGARIPELSGGMQRRLTLARALVNDPELLILDEPTTGLDPQARQLLWQRLRQLLAEGKTLLLTTHYMEEAERLCDRVVVMDAGRILAEGPPRELVRRLVEPQVVEVHGPEAGGWAERLAPLAQRVERVGETVLFYVREEGPLLRALERAGEVRFLHRPANLEDVFLRLTGRELGDA